MTTTILAACGVTTTPTGNTTSIATPTVAGGGSASTASAANQPPVAITHIHAVARDPKTGDLLLATHEGLFRHANGELLQNGPVIDLMGFTVAPDGTYYASGHPGAGVDLPQPVGLITSTDSGRTWRVSSRGGESDFHALTSSPTSVVGFDGTLRSTTDGETWGCAPSGDVYIEEEAAWQNFHDAANGTGGAMSVIDLDGDGWLDLALASAGGDVGRVYNVGKIELSAR